MSYTTRIGAAMCSALMLLSAGCGEDNPNLEGTVVPTHTESVRGWLEGVAQRGQLDSGAMVMGEEIAQLKGEGIAEADALAADFDELTSAKSSSAIRSKAQEMLKKLPPPETVSRAEG